MGLVPNGILVMVNMAMDLMAVALCITLLVDHVFPYRGDRYPPMGHGMFGVFSNTFPSRQMTQQWLSPQFSNPNVTPFAHPMYFY